MSLKKKNKKDRELEIQLKSIAEIFHSRGLHIRRENLSRGHSFRVKSGTCRFSGDDVIFVDKRLPHDQQLSVMLDYLIDLKIIPTEEELSCLPKSLLGMLSSRNLVAVSDSLITA